MAKYITKRVIYMFITMFVIASLTFFLMKLIPGSPYAGAAKLSPAQIELMNEKYGLNDPCSSSICTLYVEFVKRRFRSFFPI